MNQRIVFFNVLYYLIVFVLIWQGRSDPSSSLGYGFLIVIFWAIAGVAMVGLWVTKVIRPRSIADKIGIFTATPVLTLVVVSLIMSLTERVSSEEQFNVGQYRYKVLRYGNPGSTSGRRLEFYRSEDMVNSKGDLENDSWVKDSVWIYLSAKGDTIKKVTYKKGVEIH
jgi:hypothetical protein